MSSVTTPAWKVDPAVSYKPSSGSALCSAPTHKNPGTKEIDVKRASASCGFPVSVSETMQIEPSGKLRRQRYSEQRKLLC